MLQEIKKDVGVQILLKNAKNVFLVGGFVRDQFLEKESKDIDLLIEGLSLKEIQNLLKEFKIDSVGKSFGVLKYNSKDLGVIDIAIPRTEIKNGKGYNGFKISTDNVSVEDDLFRRDFTMNSMMINLENGELIDPFNGKNSLESGFIQIVNKNAFSEDPLRMLRAVQFAVRFDMNLSSELITLIKENAPKIKEITKDRVMIELLKINKSNLKDKFDKATWLLNHLNLSKHLFGGNLPQNKVFSEIGFFFNIVKMLNTNNRKEILETIKLDNVRLDLILDILTFGFNSEDELLLNSANFMNKHKELLRDSLVLLPINVLHTILRIDDFGHPLSFKEININGDDLMVNGLRGGDIGKMIKRIHIAILKDELKNNKTEILNFIKNKK